MKSRRVARLAFRHGLLAGLGLAALLILTTAATVQTVAVLFPLRGPAGSAGAVTYGFGDGGNNGLLLAAGNTPAISAQGASVAGFFNGATDGIKLRSDGELAWSTIGDVVSASGLRLVSPAANQLHIVASTIILGGTPRFNGSNRTGATAFAPGGTNCPAPGSCVTPFEWITVLTNDGSTGYIPVWK